MITRLHIVVRPVTGTLTFVCDVDLPALPGVGDLLTVNSEASPWLIRVFDVDQETGVVSCEVDDLLALGLNDPSIPPLQLDMVEVDVWGMGLCGWQPTKPTRAIPVPSGEPFNPNLINPIIGVRLFTDGITRKIYRYPTGRQYVLGDDGRPIYGVWVHPDEYNEPVIVEEPLVPARPERED
jgi:hypothetical protein